jgi:hypothetical protein
MPIAATAGQLRVSGIFRRVGLLRRRKTEQPRSRGDQATLMCGRAAEIKTIFGRAKILRRVKRGFGRRFSPM